MWCAGRRRKVAAFNLREKLGWPEVKHCCEELTHLKRPWCWERLRPGEGYDRGWDGWVASLTQWTWVWINSGSWWWTGKPGMLRFMVSQRVGHDWETELTWNLVDDQNDLGGSLLKIQIPRTDHRHMYSHSLGVDPENRHFHALSFHRLNTFSVCVRHHLCLGDKMVILSSVILTCLGWGKI